MNKRASQLLWSLRIDLQTLRRLRKISLFQRILLILKKYIFIAVGVFRKDKGRLKSYHLLGHVLRGRSAFDVASLQRVYCDAAVLQDYMPPGAAVIDIGANIGQFHLFARHYLRASQVVSIEPFPDTFGILSENVGDQKAVNAAISTKTGQAEFFISTISSQHNTLYPHSDPQYTRSTTVYCMTLDALIGSSGLQKIDLLKIDAEGAELDILQSGAGRLDMINYILVELKYGQPQNIMPIMSFLCSNGFSLIDIIAFDKKERVMDVLFGKT
jgi:FkbM family methyltransferase